MTTGAEDDEANEPKAQDIYAGAPSYRLSPDPAGRANADAAAEAQSAAATPGSSDEAKVLEELAAIHRELNRPPIIVFFGFSGSGKTTFAYRIQEARGEVGMAVTPEIGDRGVVEQTGEISVHSFKGGRGKPFIIVDLPGERFGTAMDARFKGAEKAILQLMASADGYALFLEAEGTLHGETLRREGGGEQTKLNRQSKAVERILNLADIDEQLAGLVRKLGDPAKAAERFAAGYEGTRAAKPRSESQARAKDLVRDYRASRKPIFLALSKADRLAGNSSLEDLTGGEAVFDDDPLRDLAIHQPTLYHQLSEHCRLFRVDFSTAYKGLVDDQTKRDLEALKDRGCYGVHGNFAWLEAAVRRTRGSLLSRLLRRVPLVRPLTHLAAGLPGLSQTRLALEMRRTWQPAFGTRDGRDVEPAPRPPWSWLFWLVDGRSYAAAAGNKPFPKPRLGRTAGVAVAPSVGVLALYLVISLLSGCGGEMTRPRAQPFELPTVTPAQRTLLTRIEVFNKGVWDGRVRPWGAVPTMGVSSIESRTERGAVEAVRSDVDQWGRRFEWRAWMADGLRPGAGAEARDLRLRLQDAERRIKAGSRTATPYHRGLVALWSGDAATAGPEFQGVLKGVEVARESRGLARVDGLSEARIIDRMRLDGLEASANYGLGLVAARRGDWALATAKLEAALAMGGRASKDYTAYRADTSRLATLRADTHLAPLDLSAVQNDLLIVRLRSETQAAARRNAFQRFFDWVVQRIRPAAERPFDAEVRDLAGMPETRQNPVLTANLALLRALAGDTEGVRGLTEEMAPPPAGPEGEAVTGAAALARSIVGLPSNADQVAAAAPALDAVAPTDGEPPASASPAVDEHLRDFLEQSRLQQRTKAALDAYNIEGAKPDAPDFQWYDPVTYRKWRDEIGRAAGAALLARAESYRDSDPAKAAWIYDRIVQQGAWLPFGVRAEAWWRLATGRGVATLYAWLVGCAALALAAFLGIRRFQRNYRSTFEALHARDREATAR